MSMDDAVRIPLTDAEKAEYGERLARMLAERKALVDQRKQAMDEAQEDIDTLQAEIDLVAEDLREGRTEKRQGDLFHEEKLPPAQASQALGKIARLPSEPHAFEGKRKECGICGAERKDPIHDGVQASADGTFAFDGSEPAPAAVRTHAAVDPALDKDEGSPKRGRKRTAEAGA